MDPTDPNLANENSHPVASPARAAQTVRGSGNARQAVLGVGVQNIYIGESDSHDQVAVSIAPPFGQRDERFPFRGRDQLLKLLIDRDPPPAVRVVHGLGGCGKTRLALEAAYHAQQRGAEVWWVSAADHSRLVAGMRAVGRRLGLTAADLQCGDAADLIWQRLDGAEREWMLIIDNADDPQILAQPGLSVSDGTGWLRPVRSAAGLVLVTSRDGRRGSWGPWCRLYLIGVLPSDEAVRVLADYAGRNPDLGGNDEAALLAERLGGLPLALKIAGSFLAESAAVPIIFSEPETCRSYGQYLDAIKSGDLDSVFPVPAGGELTSEQAQGVIGRTWELTVDLLEGKGFPEARRVLRLLASLADAPVPYELLLQPTILGDSASFVDVTGPRLWRVLQALAGVGLIDLSDRGCDRVALARLHPLVRDTSRAHALGEEYGEYVALAARLLHCAAKNTDKLGDPEDPVSWPLWQTLAPHASYVFEALSSAVNGSDEMVIVSAYAAHRAARYQAALGLSARAESVQRAVLTVWTRLLGDLHPLTLTGRYVIAHEMAAQGDHAGAEAEYRGVLDAQVRVLGPEHLDTLKTRHEIALEMSKRGNHVGAQAAYRDVLEARLQVLGTDHPDVLAIRHAIAYEMSVTGDHAGAEAEYRDVLAAELQALGPDHRFTLSTRNAIAYEMSVRGDHAGAEAEYRDVWAVRLRVLGADHPFTLSTRQAIAYQMAIRGDVDGAEAEYRDVLAIQVRVLGAEHRSTLITRHEVARMFKDRGDLDAAEAEYRSVLAIQSRVLGANHSDTVATAKRLAALARERSQ